MRWKFICVAAIVLSGVLGIASAAGAAPAVQLSSTHKATKTPVPTSTPTVTNTPVSTFTPTATAVPTNMPTATATVAPTPPTTVTPTNQELVYVANADSGPVTAYSANATRPVQPVSTVNNPQNPQTFWAPWRVTFDSASNVYVQTFLSDATSFVFGPSSPTPSRIFRVAGPDTESIAVDSQGDEYVIGGEGPPVISIAAPGASGSPSNLYSVNP